MDINRRGAQPSRKNPRPESHRRRALGVVGILLAASVLSCDRGRDREEPNGLVGAWKRSSLEEGGADGKPHRADATGAIVFTCDGRMSVQVMYRDTGSETTGGPVQYAQGGYEASFGRYEIDEKGHRFTYHVKGALVRSLIGKNLKRFYESSDTRLVVKPPTADEHWRVTWARY